MNENIDLKKASSFYLVGTFFNKGIVFLTVPIFTRILSVSDYGLVTTYNSWVSIFTIVLSLALYMAVRASFVDYKEKTNDFLSVTLVFVCVFGSSISSIVLIFSVIIPIDVNIGLIALCLLQSVSAALIENVSMYWMMSYKYKVRTAIMVLPNMLSAIVAVIVIRFFLSNDLYLGRIVSNALITFLFGVVALFYGLHKSNVRFNKEYISYGLKVSIPLVFHGLALAVLSQSDRTMITVFRNSSETGVYGLIYNFSMIATVITTAFDGIWVPFFTLKMNENEYLDINKFVNKYVDFMTVAMVGVVLVGPEVVKLLASSDYWEGISIIPPIVLSNYLIFIYTLYVNIEHYYKKTIFISINTAIAALSNIILNVFFIKRWGYVGAAYTTLISYTLSLFLHYSYSRKLNEKLFPLKQIAFPLTVIIIVVLIFYIFLDIWFIRWVIAILCLGGLIIRERKWLIDIMKR